MQRPVPNPLQDVPEQLAQRRDYLVSLEAMVADSKRLIDGSKRHIAATQRALGADPAPSGMARWMLRSLMHSTFQQSRPRVEGREPVQTYNQSESPAR